MVNDDFKTDDIILCFNASGILGIFTALVKSEISEINPRFEIWIKYGVIFLCAISVQCTCRSKIANVLILMFLVVARGNQIGLVANS